MIESSQTPSLRAPLKLERNLALIFALLGALITAGIAAYWMLVLEPALRSDARSDLRVLAQAQANSLEQRIGSSPPARLRRGLETDLDRMLLLRDPGTGLNYMQRITLRIHDDPLERATGGLDIARGVDACPECFVFTIPLYHPLEQQLIGIATFYGTPNCIELTVGRFRNTLWWGSAIMLCGIGVAWLGTGRLIRRLRDREAQLQSLFDHAPAVIATKDLHGRYRSINRHGEALLGIRNEQIVGKTPDQVLPDALAEPILASDQAILSSLTPQTLEQELETRAGTLTLLTNQFPIFDGDGKPTGFCSISLDITERLRTKRALHVALVKFRTLFEAFPLGVTVIDRAGRLIETNQASEPLLGLDRDTQLRQGLDARPWSSLLGLEGPSRPGDAGVPSPSWLQDTVIRDRETRITLPNNEVRWLGVTIAPLPVADLGAVIVYEDITLRRQAQAAREAEAALRESERRFRIMADELPIGIWVKDWTISKTFVNKTYRTYFGLSEADLTEQGWHAQIHPRDRDAYVESFDAHLRTHTPFSAHCRMRRSDGQWRWVESFVRPFSEPDGRFAGIVGANVDITERKQAEDALHASHRELERRTAQLEMLTSQLTLAEQRERERLAQVLHDHLQQLLVGAVLGVERVSSRSGGRLPDAKAQEALEVVEDLLREAITAARTLVADLSPPILHEGGLGDALDWLARRVEDQHGLIVEARLDHDASPRRADVRSVLFESVREALFNVVKHARCTKAEIGLERQEDGRIRVIIEDQGAGADTAELLKGGGQGLGFGLLTMRERLHALGGEFRIESEPGKGLRLTLIAPPETETGVPPLPDSAVSLAPSIPRAQSLPPEVHPRTRILLVDDHPMMRQGMSAVLEDEPDLQVVGEASNGREAIEQVERLNPGIVLMDHSMPVMDGLEATRRIKARWPAVRVIALSIYREAERAEAMLNAGASAYVTKSAGSAALLEAIRRQVPASS